MLDWLMLKEIGVELSTLCVQHGLRKLEILEIQMDRQDMIDSGIELCPTTRIPSYGPAAAATILRAHCFAILFCSEFFLGPKRSYHESAKTKRSSFAVCTSLMALQRIAVYVAQSAV